MICEWCGHEHGVDVLCSKRPKWSRRGFLYLMGAAAVGVTISPIDLMPMPISCIIYGSDLARFIDPIHINELISRTEKYTGRSISLSLSGVWG